MQKIKISTAQFENKSGDKKYNLSVIERLAQQAAKEGSDVIAFHECSVTGYTFARNLSKEKMSQRRLMQVYIHLPCTVAKTTKFTSL